MTVKERAKYIEELDTHLKDLIRVIEVIDPIRNDTDANDYYDTDRGMDMVTIPRFKSWIIRIKNKLSLKVKRIGGYEPIELDISSKEVIDAISKALCEKRDWYRNQIEKMNKI